jgi:hypothetical protein
MREEDDSMEGAVQGGKELGQVDETMRARNYNEGSTGLTVEKVEPKSESSLKPFGVFADPQTPKQASEAGIESAAKPKLKSVKFDTTESPNHHTQLADHVSKNLAPKKDVGIAEKSTQGVKRKAESSKPRSKSMKIDVETEKPVLDGLRRSGRTKRAGA